MAARILAINDDKLTAKLQQWAVNEADKVNLSRLKLGNMPAAPEESYK